MIYQMAYRSLHYTKIPNKTSSYKWKNKLINVCIVFTIGLVLRWFDTVPFHPSLSGSLSHFKIYDKYNRWATAIFRFMFGFRSNASESTLTNLS